MDQDPNNYIIYTKSYIWLYEEVCGFSWLLYVLQYLRKELRTVFSCILSYEL